MPVTPSSTHQPGSYPTPIRHISNGDPCNQTYLRNPMLDLEYRTDALMTELNLFETSTATNFSFIVNFDDNHTHNGFLGEKVLDLAQAYANGTPTSDWNLAQGGALRVRQHGGSTALVLLELDDAGVTPATQIQFPGSVGMFAHVGASAADRGTNPHNLKLFSRLYQISLGCLVGSTQADGSGVLLSTTAASGSAYSALGLAGAASSDGTTNEGVLVGPNSPSQASPQNLVLVLDAGTNGQIGVSGSPVYGVLSNGGTPQAPVWQLSFYAGTAPYVFASGSNKTLKLYGQYAYSLATVPTVDPRFNLVAQLGLAGV